MNWDDIGKRISEIQELERRTAELKRELLMGAGRYEGFEATSWLLFTVFDRRFVMPLHQVEEVVQMPDLMPSPGSSRVMAGLLNLRGRIMAVIDLAAMILGKKNDIRADKCLLICSVAQRSFGLMVDDVEDVAVYPQEAFAPSEEMLSGSLRTVAVLRTDSKALPVLDAAAIAYSADLSNIDSTSTVEDVQDDGKPR